MTSMTYASMSHAERHGLIDPLFAECPRPPDRVVCANCHLGPECRGVEHYAPVAEDSICLWPCRHEVRQGEGECSAAECVVQRKPDAVDQGAPW